MSSYQGINPFIVKLVRKYSSQLYFRLSQKIEINDLKQELLLASLQSLKKFDPKKGYIEDFLNTCLFQKCNEIARAYSLDIRKVFFCTVPLTEIPVKDLPAESSMKNTIQQLDILECFPKRLRHLVEKLKHISKSALRKTCSNDEFRAINKIFQKVVNTEEEKYRMKNISCIETLSVRELSKLSEVDLCDLSEKISETHKWIKQLVEKFEMALETKYAGEAKKYLHEIGMDFGTCEIKKNGFVVNVQMPKKVQWDQESLKAIYNQVTPKTQKDIFKVTYSVDERKYAKLDQIMREYLSPARTTTYGKIKISINKNKDMK